MGVLLHDIGIIIWIHGYKRRIRISPGRRQLTGITTYSINEMKMWLDTRAPRGEIDCFIVVGRWG